MTRRYVPQPEEIPSGICECGCGLPTNIVMGQSYPKKRQFLGYPYAFRKGHSLTWTPPPRNDHLKGERHPFWKGGRYINTTTGYVMVHVPGHHLATSKNYAPEHRLIMEQHLGRPLQPDEVVHHNNGDKQDNSLNNLVLMHRNNHVSHHRTGIKMPDCTIEHRQRLSHAAKKAWAVGPRSAEERRAARIDTLRRYYAKKQKGQNQPSSVKLALPQPPHRSITTLSGLL